VDRGSGYTESLGCTGKLDVQCGGGTFREHLLPPINGGKLADVPGVMVRFDRAAGMVLPVLERRRKAEAGLFGS